MSDFSYLTCINHPYEVIDSFFQSDLTRKQSETQHESSEHKYYESLTQNPSFRNIVPKIASRSDVRICTPNSLVKYTGIVQDIFNNEFLESVYEEMNITTSQSILKSSKYRESIYTSCDYELSIAEDSKPIERCSILCGPVPGLCSWVKDVSNNDMASAVSADVMMLDDLPMDTKRSMTEDQHEEPRKRQNVGSMTESVDRSNDTLSTEHLKDSLSEDISCLVRLYNDESPKLNDLVEVYGIYTIDQVSPPMESSYGIEEFDDFDQSSALTHLPSSTTPRLQCIIYRRLGSSYPLLRQVTLRDDIMSYEMMTSSDKNHISSNIHDLLSSINIMSCRAQAMDMIAHALGGDVLLAQYMLLTVLSRVYARDVTQSVGCITLNISHTSHSTSSSSSSLSSSSTIHHILDRLHAIIPRVVHIDGDIDSLNNQPCLRPSRDFDKNMMNISPLQFGDGAVLIINETKTSSKHGIDALNASGRLSLDAIRSIISMQKLPIHYGFYEIDLPTNNAVIIISKDNHESIVTKDFITDNDYGSGSNIIRIRLQHAYAYDNHIQPDVDSIDISSIRSYWAMVRMIEVTMPDDVLKRAEDDFVNARIKSRDDRLQQSMVSAVDFHRWLSLARLLAISYGIDKITAAIWDEMMMLERQRELRASVHHEAHRAQSPVRHVSHNNPSPKSVTLDQNPASRF